MSSFVESPLNLREVFVILLREKVIEPSSGQSMYIQKYLDAGGSSDLTFHVSEFSLALETYSADGFIYLACHRYAVRANIDIIQMTIDRGRKYDVTCIATGRKSRCEAELQGKAMANALISVMEW